MAGVLAVASFFSAHSRTRRIGQLSPTIVFVVGIISITAGVAIIVDIAFIIFKWLALVIMMMVMAAVVITVVLVACGVCCQGEGAQFEHCWGISEYCEVNRSTGK